MLHWSCRLILALLLMISPVGNGPADAAQSSAASGADKSATTEPAPRCRIGKPSYCFKYGQTRCETANKVGAGKCPAWLEGCLACHRPIAACLGGPVAAGTLKCGECNSQWLACMRANDTKHWPNRRSE
jgi:hypothetical protein